jgi:SAM-dependent methyltransferase
MRLIQSLYGFICQKIFTNYSTELKRAIGACKSILDLGCGPNSPLRFFSDTKYCVGVDQYKPSIERSKKLGIHSEYYLCDILSVGQLFKENSFDCVLANDVIEHLTKKDGYRLISLMENIASKKVIIFTPNGFLEQGTYKNNPWQQHKSGWTVNEFRKKGYVVKGINGFFKLRTKLAQVKFKPRVLWELISNISQFFIQKWPEYAFQLLCVKTK